MAKKDKIILDELKQWNDDGLITKDLYNNLSKMYDDKSWNINTIIRWTLILGSIMLGIGLISFISIIFQSLGFVVLVLTLLFSICYYFGFNLTEKTYSHYYPKTGNALVAIGSLLLASDMFAFTTLLNPDIDANTNWPILLFTVSVIYFIIAYYKKTTLVLIFGLLGLASWYGTETGYMSGWGAYYLGLNYPMRFALISPILILIGYLHKKYNVNVPESFVKTYYSFGLLYVNLSLWIMSIFGNYGSMDSWWSQSAKGELLAFSIIWGVADVIIFAIGSRYKNTMFTGYAIVFLILNLYTRYFEFLWNEMNKSLFFIILGFISVGAGIYFEKKLKTNHNNLLED